jgi:hypothetical protein
MKRIIAVVFVIYSLSFLSCRHPTQLENAPVISFQNDVLPLLSSNCAQSECHGSGESEAFPLTSYNDVMNSETVAPGNAHGSSLYLCLTGRGGVGLMPPGSQPTLTDNQIAVIYLWIEEGAIKN